ncbi:DMT family transporter [Natroniella sulfidigena]|uniref:DMT family transporter n=1 Tax=Natroniella sulfidigena TaxID=723921 RepID=UPI00200B090C|nr:DMT family transporter [Natroniella sulfidigena]MCK8816578.1 DMT family transporter [Natroniella sulfidigena]
MIKKEEYLAMLAGIVAAVIFGFSFMFTKDALDLMSPFQLLGFRFICAVMLLTTLKLMNIIEINFANKDLHSLFLLALFQPVIYFLFETLGVKLTSSSQAGMMIALIPVVVTILSAIFLKEKPSRQQLVFIIMSVIGVVFIILMAGSGEMETRLTGIFLLLGAVLAGGIYNILSRKSSLQFSPVEITYIMMVIGAVVFNGVAIIQHLLAGELTTYFLPLIEIEVIVAIVYLGALSSVVAFFMLNFMLSKIEASRSAVFTNLTPIVAVIAGVVFRGESFYWFQAVGGLMILIGVWGTNYFAQGDRLKKSNFDNSVEL